MADLEELKAEYIYEANHNPDPALREKWAQKYSTLFGGEVPAEVPFAGPESLQPTPPAAVLRQRSALERGGDMARSLAGNMAGGVSMGYLGPEEAYKRAQEAYGQAQLFARAGGVDPLVRGQFLEARRREFEAAKADLEASRLEPEAGMAGKLLGGLYGVGGRVASNVGRVAARTPAGRVLRDTVGGALGGGVEGAGSALVEGKGAEEALKAGGVGALVGGAVSGGARQASEGLHAVSPAVAGRAAAEAAGRIDPIRGTPRGTPGVVGEAGVARRSILARDAEMAEAEQAARTAREEALPGRRDVRDVSGAHRDLDALVDRYDVSGLPVDDATAAAVANAKRRIGRQGQVFRETPVEEIYPEAIPEEPGPWRQLPPGGQRRLTGKVPEKVNTPATQPDITMEGQQELIPEATGDDMLRLRRAVRQKAQFGARGEVSPEVQANRGIYRGVNQTVQNPERGGVPGLRELDDASHAAMAARRRRMDILTRNEAGMRPSDANVGVQDLEMGGYDQPMAGRVADELAADKNLALIGDESKPAQFYQPYLRELGAQDPAFATALQRLQDKKYLEATRLLNAVTGDDVMGKTLSQVAGGGGNLLTGMGAQGLRATASKIDRYALPAARAFAPTLRNPVDALMARLRAQQEQEQ